MNKRGCLWMLVIAVALLLFRGLLGCFYAVHQTEQVIVTQFGKPVGYLNPLLYGSLVGIGAFRDIVSGNNGRYSAGKGWDPCTGWGSPVGNMLLQALAGSPH